MTEPGPSTTEPSPSTNRRALAIAGLAVLALVVVAALAGGVATPPGAPTFPPAGATAGPAGGSAAATSSDLVRAIAARGLQSEPATRPYRPAEAPQFATAPRVVLQVLLPDDPDHGLVVVYEFLGPAVARAAAQEQAAYVASGIGRVQFPPDTRFVVRVVGSTAVFFSWSPANSPDARIESIAAALESVGSGVPIPN
ncbi:MAG TPA: hypothetical protein VLS28_13125 [Candidatus Sulfomarinibacteraceae bacterium]|nr:hypothetical protein [Candidatus Sulfomarinibacteraceae bacterium]